MTEAEARRRQAVIDTIVARSTNPSARRAEGIRDLVQIAEEAICKRLWGEKFAPFVSADYFNWRVDRAAWEAART